MYSQARIYKLLNRREKRGEWSRKKTILMETAVLNCTFFKQNINKVCTTKYSYNSFFPFFFPSISALDHMYCVIFKWGNTSWIGGVLLAIPTIPNLPTHPDLLNVYCGYVASLLQERELFVYCFST